MSHVRVAIITGAGQGIGAGVAKSFATAGFSVSLMSPSDRSVKLARQLDGIGRQGSVLDPEDLAALIEETQAAYGRIDAVVNNMGHGSGTPPSVTASTVFDPDSFRTRSRCRTRRGTRRSTCTSSPPCAWLAR
jgi:NAD(P)-dependent dehydrogenase (short-subunit alcohol dehydrogenase family)